MRVEREDLRRGVDLHSTAKDSRTSMTAEENLYPILPLNSGSMHKQTSVQVKHEAEPHGPNSLTAVT